MFSHRARSVDAAGHVMVAELQKWWMSHEAEDGLFRTVKLSLAQLVTTSERLLFAGLSVMYQPVKIFISYWQVVSQIGAVSSSIPLPDYRLLALTPLFAIGGACR